MCSKKTFSFLLRVIWNCAEKYKKNSHFATKNNEKNIQNVKSKKCAEKYNKKTHISLQKTPQKSKKMQKKIKKISNKYEKTLYKATRSAENINKCKKTWTNAEENILENTPNKN